MIEIINNTKQYFALINAIKRLANDKIVEIFVENDGFNSDYEDNSIGWYITKNDDGDFEIECCANFGTQYKIKKNMKDTIEHFKRTLFDRFEERKTMNVCFRLDRFEIESEMKELMNNDEDNSIWNESMDKYAESVTCYTEKRKIVRGWYGKDNHGDDVLFTQSYTWKKSYYEKKLLGTITKVILKIFGNEYKGYHDDNKILLQINQSQKKLYKKVEEIYQFTRKEF